MPRAGFVGRMGPIGRRGGAFSHFKAAVALSRNGVRNTVIACIGDSTTAGSGAGGPNGGFANARALGYPAKLSALINANIVSSRASSVNGNQNQSPTNYPIYNPEMSFQDTAQWTTTGSTYGTALFTATGTDSRMIWTPTGPVDTFEVWYVGQSGSGSMRIYFDGSATITDGFSTAGADVLVKKTYTLARGTHSIEIARSPSPNINVCQIIAYDSTQKQALVFNGGQPSARATNLSSTSTNYASLNVVKALRPDLCILNVGINDWDGGTTQASFEASLNAIVDAARVTGDIVFVFPNSIGNGLENTFKGYFQNVAAAKSVPLIDLRDVLGTIANANANGWMSGDNVHPSEAGYAVIAQYIFDTIKAGIA